MKKGILIGLIIGILITGTTVYATYKYQASEVGYTPSNSNWKVDNIEDAIKDLYNSKNTSSSTIFNLSKNFEDNYFKGDADDNNVMFDGYCWKVIRIADGGNIRLLYNGEISEYNEELEEGKCLQSSGISSIGNSIYSNTFDSNNKYTESEVKKKIDEWYEKNIDLKDKIVSIGIISKAEVEKVGENSYLKNGQKYWTRTETNSTVNVERIVECTKCGNEVDNAKSAGMYIVNESGLLDISDNGTLNSYTEKTKTCQGNCNLWWSNSYGGGDCWAGASRSDKTYCKRGDDNGCGCCSYSTDNGTCTASSNGSELQVRPVVTLKSSVSITSGKGTLDSPYKIS